jgi:hypothetical protein
VCCQLEVSATRRSLVQRGPTDCGASLCVIKKPRGRGGHSPRWAAEPVMMMMMMMMMIIIIIIIIAHSSLYNLCNCFKQSLAG